MKYKYHREIICDSVWSGVITMIYDICFMSLYIKGSSTLKCENAGEYSKMNMTSRYQPEYQTISKAILQLISTGWLSSVSLQPFLCFIFDGISIISS